MKKPIVVLSWVVLATACAKPSEKAGAEVIVPAGDAAVVAVASSAAVQVPAAGKQENKPLFFCKTRHGKQIELLDAGNAIIYTFGKMGTAPELTLTVPRTQATTWQWDGRGSSESYRVNIPNGNTIYSVFWSAVHDPDAAEPVSAGVNVEIAGKYAASVECDPDTVVQSLEGVDLPLEQ